MAGDEERSGAGDRILRHGPEDETRFETAAGDEASIEQIGAHVERHVGPVDRVFHELISDLVHVDVHHVAPGDGRPFHTLVTSGMSDRPMSPPPGADAYRFTELAVLLPAAWQVSEEAFKDEAWYWPVRQLKILARLPHKFRSWLWWGHTVPHGDPPEPFAVSTELCCSMLISPVSLPDEFDTLWLEDGREVTFFSLFPLYKEEMEHKLGHGAEALLELVVRAGLDDIVDPRRLNVCRQA
ncbi:MAG: suppressor of fused domain protein [Thermoanaerobaculaceae bacterium]|nr:suppressor of fused domain protein [Thermoanaerobaculaceae bacterium]